MSLSTFPDPSTPPTPCSVPQEAELCGLPQWLGLAVGAQQQMAGRRIRPSSCVPMACWHSSSTEGLSSCQLHTALSLDSARWAEGGSIACYD